MKLKLREAGYRKQFLDDIWPTWWTDEAESDLGAQAELRFYLSRRLGLSPKPLLEDRIDFFFPSDVRCRRLGPVDLNKQKLLSSFGRSLGRILIRATKCSSESASVTAHHARRSILDSSDYVDLNSLLELCWRLKIPVVQIRNWPLEVKAMDAMVVRESNRYAVLISRVSKHQAKTAFLLARELGHVFCGHLTEGSIYIDVTEKDRAMLEGDETEATQYAFELLTGSKEGPNIPTSKNALNARALAQAALSAGPVKRIDPGTLALCFGYRTESWDVATASLEHIYRYNTSTSIADEINDTAIGRLDWEVLASEAEEYLCRILNVE